MSLDISPLLQPISAENPCGEDLSFSNAFHEIKKAKTQDDLLLDQGDWVSEPKQADWPFVAAKTSDLFIHSTKDIRLLTWLNEAWAQLYGFEGILKSLCLSQQMLDQYWLEIHPVIEDEDLDQRLGLLQGLINQLPLLIKKTPISHQQAYTLLDYENILYQQNNLRKLADDHDPLNSSTALEQFEQAINQSPQAFLIEQYQNFSDMLRQWELLKTVLNRHMELDAPSFAQIDSQLERIDEKLKKIYKTDRFSAIDAQASTLDQDQNHAQQQLDQTQMTQVTAQPAANAHFSLDAQNHLKNREHAMKVLQEISDYFAKNEPHSPVSYMLQKTIQWSQLPLHEWLAQVIKDDNPLASVQELLGVQSNTQESKDW